MSEIEILIDSWESSKSCSCSMTRITTSPAWVNLTALLTRFVTTCLIRSESPTIVAGTSWKCRCTSSRFFACAVGAIIMTTSSTSSLTCNVPLSSSSFPASIFEKSRISLMIISNISDDFLIVDKCSICRPRSWLFNNKLVKPIIPLRGVRIS